MRSYAPPSPSHYLPHHLPHYLPPSPLSWPPCFLSPSLPPASLRASVAAQHSWNYRGAVSGTELPLFHHGAC
eukprot:1182228-Rhodomonas_salina.4